MTLWHIYENMPFLILKSQLFDFTKRLLYIQNKRDDSYEQLRHFLF